MESKKPFDFVLYVTQSQHYFEDIIGKMLTKAQKFDKGLPKISEYLTKIGQNMQTLEECHCLIIKIIA